ncbi:MAG: hypothetical protein JRJ38_12550 [Deltaproteobacteria bacterium]|nr:hypothetical protein [Deltaproteobacteria bacterium]
MPQKVAKSAKRFESEKCQEKRSEEKVCVYLCESVAKQGVMKKLKPNKLWLSIIIFSLSFLLYLPSLWYPFVWDDTSIIHTEINTIKDHGILWGGGGLYYRPLVGMSFVVDNVLWAGKAHGFHLTNMMLNSLNCVLVFILGTFLFKKNSSATKAQRHKRTLILNLERGLLAPFFAALIFLCHPAHADSVAWIAGRTDILASTYFLVSFLSYVIYRETSNKKALIVTGLSFVLALLSKEIAIALPVVFLMYDLLIFRKGTRTSLAILGGCAIFLVAYLTARGGSDPTAVFSAMSTKMSLSSDKLTLIDYLKETSYGLGFYWKKTMLPARLTIFPEIHNGWNLFFLSIFIILIGITAIKKSSFLGFSAGLFLVSLLPSLPVLFFNLPSPVAIRYLYLPVLGVSLGLAYAIGEMKKANYQIISLFLIILIFSGLSIYREFDWKQSEILWKREIAENNSMFARAQYIGCLLEKEKIDQAEKEIETAMRTLRDSEQELAKHVISALYSHLGVILAKKGDMDGAEKALLEAKKYDPTKGDIYHNLAFLYLRQYEESRSKEKLEKAKTFLFKSLKIQPGSQSSAFLIAFISELEGNIEEAKKWYEKTVKLNPYTRVAKRAKIRLAVMEGHEKRENEKETESRKHEMIKT